MATSSRFLFNNGVVIQSPHIPPISTFLESHPGAYTTTRTHNNATHILFWDRHLQRLANSARILFNSSPKLFFNNSITVSNEFLTLPPLESTWDLAIKTMVDDGLRQVLPHAVRERRDGEELAVTAVVSGNLEKLKNVGDENRVFEMLDVLVHVGSYVAPVFGVGESGARLALVGHGRDFAGAKYADWVRQEKEVFGEAEDNNKDKGNCFHGNENSCPFEVQTAPISDGVLPGVIRQVVIDVCLSMGIPVREVAPSWSMHEFWQEAFITSSLRILQHVEKIRVPESWESLQLKSLEEILWEEKQFEKHPGMITAMIQKEIMTKAGLEGQLC